MIRNREDMSILLVGGSGEGKSEFILSFIDSKDRMKIPASGKGQTTRTSMIYSIDCMGKQPLSIKLQLKSKEQFCVERLMAFWDRFNLDDCSDEFLRDGFKVSLLEDKAFFDHKEFLCYDEISSIYDEIFDEAFFLSIKEENDDEAFLSTKEENDDEGQKVYVVPFEKYEICYKKLKGNISDCDNNDEKDIEDCFQIFIEWVYDKCKDEVMVFLKNQEGVFIDTQNETIDVTSVKEIQYFIKTEEGKISYSSLVEKITFDTSIAEYYGDMMNEIGVNKLKFIDTYGLNHDKVATSELVKKRYQKLFREFCNVNTVLYIRKAQSTPPTDLLQNIPLIYSVKPSIMSYICFTHADSADNDGEKAIKEMCNQKSSVYRDVYKQLKEADVNSNLARQRIKCMAENVVQYCSKVGLDDGYNRFIKKNIEDIKKLLLSIRDKKHLGDLVININKMSLERISDVIDVESIFNPDPQSLSADFYYGYPESFHGYPGRTMGALGNRLQEGRLGFCSSTWGDFKYWDDEIFALVKNRFFNIIKLNWKDYLENENVVPVIQSIFNDFMDITIKCIKDPKENFTNHPVGKFCQSCEYKNSCIQNVIYEAKRDVIRNKYKYARVYEWLTEIYDFTTLVSNESTREKLQTIFDELYQKYFIAWCRDNNARVLASKLNMDSSINEKDEEIQKYFNDKDSNLDDVQREEFEERVLQFLDI